MGRRFTKSSFPDNQTARLEFLPVVTDKISFSYTIKHASLPGPNYPDRHHIIIKCKDQAELNYAIVHAQDVLYFVWTTAPSVYAVQAGSYTWDLNEHNVVVSMDWDNDTIGMWVDGVPLSVSTSSLTSTPQTAGMPEFLVGYQPGLNDELDGTLYELAIFTGTALDQTAVDELNAGISADQIRGVSHYWELCGYNAITVTFIHRELDYINGNYMEFTGNVSVVDHVRVYHLGGEESNWFLPTPEAAISGAQLITCM